jgi:hypothetical protein
MGGYHSVIFHELSEGKYSMSETEKTLHFLDLDWTITVEHLTERLKRERISSITIKNARHGDISSMRLSPEKAANLIRLLQQAIAQAYEWERTVPEGVVTNERR